MPIRVRIRHSNVKHYLVSTLKLVMKADGAVLPEVTTGPDKSIPGKRRFDVPEGAARVELHVEIPKFGAGSKRPVLTFDQRFKVAVTAGKPPRLEPTIFEPFLIQRGPKQYHPRLSEPTTAASGKHKLFDLILDLRFLDVTDLADALGLLDNFKNRPLPCEIRLFEDTHSFPDPVTWVVAVPPALVEGRRTGVFLFYRPEILPEAGVPLYKDTRTAPPGRYARYLVSPAPQSPFFVSSSNGFLPNPLCGFEDQLKQANKRVVLLMPLPHITSYGLGEGPPMVATVEALLDAMWIEGAISGLDLRPPIMTRLAVGGFSSGGNTALAALKDHPNEIDELYLFDPGVWDPSRIPGWIAGGSNRRLRMTGGGYSQTQMIAMVRQLAGRDVLLLNDRLDYWHTNKLYLGALSEVGKRDEGFDPAPAPGSTVTRSMPATIEKNIFLVPFQSSPPPVAPARLTLEGHWIERGRPRSGRRVVELPSIVEAASVVRFALKGEPPFTTDQAFTNFITLITFNPKNKGEPRRIVAIRHSWAVCGGVSSGRSRSDPDFKGYLQIFLEKSGF